MLLYLSSKKFGNSIEILKEWIKEHDNKILLIFNALDAKDKEKIKSVIKDDLRILEDIGFDVKIIDLKEYFNGNKDLKEEFINYNACCVIGGNVFVLRQAMKYSRFDEFLYQKLFDDNYLYVGYSAGSCVLSPNLRLLKLVDEPINVYGKKEIIYEGLNIVDYLIIPHYKSEYHKSNLIDEIVKRCEQEDINFRALKDGESIIYKLKQ